MIYKEMLITTTTTKKNERLSLLHLDKRRLNSNFIIFKETEDADQLFSKSMRTRVKDVASEHENVRLTYRGGNEFFREVVKSPVKTKSDSYIRELSQFSGRQRERLWKTLRAKYA